MASPLDALKTPIGPAPAWVWLAGGGLVLYLGPKLGLFGRKPSTIPTNAPPAGLVPPGFVPAGSQPAQSPSTATTPGSTAGSSTATVRASNSQIGTAFRPRPDVFSGLLSTVPEGTQLQVLGNQQGPNFQGPSTWYLTRYGQQVGWINAQDLQFTGGGSSGGGGTSRIAAGHAPGRRSDAPWHWHGHPLLKAQAHYPHYVLPGQGGASIHAVARSAGLHPARLMAVNPHLHGPGRGGPDASGGPDDVGMGGFTDYESQPDWTPPPTSRGPGAGIAPADIGLQYMRVPGAPLPASGGPRLPPGRVARAGQLIRVR